VDCSSLGFARRPRGRYSTTFGLLSPVQNRSPQVVMLEYERNDLMLAMSGSRRIRAMLNLIFVKKILLLSTTLWICMSKRCCLWGDFYFRGAEDFHNLCLSTRIVIRTLRCWKFAYLVTSIYCGSVHWMRGSQLADHSWAFFEKIFSISARFLRAEDVTWKEKPFRFLLPCNIPTLINRKILIRENY
jgi:hypothetical protein